LSASPVILKTGIQLNADKRDIIMVEINTLTTFNDFIHVNKENMILLGAPVLKGKAQDKFIKDKINDLTRAVDLANSPKPIR